MITPITDGDIPHSSLPFTPALIANGFIFVSGQASVDDSGAIISDTFEGEFRRSLNNIRRILEAAGASLEQVVQVRGYVRDPANIPLYNKLYREYFNEPFPARTTLTHCLPSTLQFEIECIAVVKPENGG